MVSCTVQTMSMQKYKFNDYSQVFPRQVTGLHLIARFGLLHLLEKLLVERDDVEADSKDNDGQPPRLWAAPGGHEAVVKLLRLELS